MSAAEVKVLPILAALLEILPEDGGCGAAADIRS
jgi:hypothetical protein